MIELFLQEKKVYLFNKRKLQTHFQWSSIWNGLKNERKPDSNSLGLPKSSLIPKDTHIHFSVWAARVVRGYKSKTLQICPEFHGKFILVVVKGIQEREAWTGEFGISKNKLNAIFMSLTWTCKVKVSIPYITQGMVRKCFMD